MKKLLSFFTLTLLCLSSVMVFGQTVYVNSSTGNDATGDGSVGNPYQTFYKGYTMTSSGGTLDLTGTFTWTDAGETGDAAISGYTINKNITIQGQGAGSTIVQAAATPNTADRKIFTISTSSYTIIIKDLTVRNGNVNGNYRGGGIETGYSTNLSLLNCIIEDNNITTVSTDNRYYGGGGVSVWQLTTGTVIIDNCIIRNNANLQVTYGSGGGLFISMGDSNSGEIIVTNSTFNGNYAPSGAAIKTRSPRLKLTNSTIAYNSGSTSIVTSQGSSGYNHYAYLTNLTVAYNSLGTNGYGIALSSIPHNIKNVISVQNKRTDNSQWDYTRSGGTFVNNGYNLIEVQNGSDFTDGVNGDIVGLQDCLGLDNTLALNGSSNVSTTLALNPNSVAINAGDNAANGAVSVPTTDQRGTSRVGVTDMGAYEFTGTIATPVLTVSETTLSGFSYIAGAGPSSSQTFNVSGVDLVGDIVITPTSSYEVSDGGSYGSSVTLTPVGGTVSLTSISIRIKSGFGAGTYNGSVTISTACDESTITLSGSVVSVPASTYIWTGTTSNDWNTGSNWSLGSVPTIAWHAIIPASVTNLPEINNSLASPAICNNLTVNEGATCSILSNSGLTVNGDIDNNGTIIIESSATGEGSLLVSGSISGSGTYDVERYLTANLWHQVSSSITAGTAGVFEGLWLRAYDEATNTFGEYIVPTDTPMPTGQGFSVWAPDSQTRTFTGTINNGNVGPLSAQLTGVAGPNQGWNLVGNPYPSSLDWDAASGWTKTNIANSVYVWNNNQYASYIGGIGTNGGSRYIAPEQGFFVQASSAGASLSMDNDIRLHNGVSFLKETTEPLDIIRIQVVDNEYSDEAVIAIREGSSNSFDHMTDAVKLPGSSSAPQMYSSKDDLSHLAISCLSSIDDIFGKAVYLDYAQDGEHVISWSHTLQGATIPVLYDNHTGTTVPAGTPYVYTASSGDPVERFTFTETLSSIDNHNFSVNVWEHNNILYIQNETNDYLKNVTIYNMQGQVVMDFRDNMKDLNSLSPAQYIVKVSTENGIVVNKIIVK